MPAMRAFHRPRVAGITPAEEEALVAQTAECRLFMFVKEDEDLYPNLDYAPIKERTSRAMMAIERVKEKRNGLGIIFASHVSGAPHEILETIFSALDAGANAVMFSETFAGGTVRMVREATRHLENPPAIYGHNAGIGVKTRGIWREVIDLLARLDGIDFRQTAPVRPGQPFLRPYGIEWEASEEVLTRSIPGIKPTMITRAGALDQGNIGLNLTDAENRGLTSSIMFLAGSAINSIKNKYGNPDPQIGAEAMQQAIDIHRTSLMKDISPNEHVSLLSKIAKQKKFYALSEALNQRYGI